MNWMKYANKIKKTHQLNKIVQLQKPRPSFWVGCWFLAIFSDCRSLMQKRREMRERRVIEWNFFLLTISLRSLHSVFVVAFFVGEFCVFTFICCYVHLAVTKLKFALMKPSSKCCRFYIAKLRHDQTCANILFLDRDEMGEESLHTQTYTRTLHARSFLNNLLRAITMWRDWRARLISRDYWDDFNCSH